MLEGITENVHLVGDVMLDALNWARQRSVGAEAAFLQRFGLKKKQYLVATLHRSENTDDGARFQRILETFNSLNEPVVFPVHPRAQKIINEINFRPKTDLHLIDPVGYLEMVALVGAARLILTDSGGLQKEAYWLGIPCVTLRNETEWVETVEAGWNVLVGSEPERIARTVKTFIPPDARPLLYGDGTAADKCVDLIGLKSEPMALVGRA